MTTAKPPVPVNIIAGGLGAGKTTAINHLLGQRPEGERWAVLVNEYGEVGVDAALLAQQGVRSRVEIKEVAGGCICCSAGFMFEMALTMLLSRRPSRLIIEPTGLATLTGIVEVLQSPGLRDAVDLRSVITLIDASRLGACEATPEEQDQVAAADILLANHVDRTAPEHVERFLRTAEAAFPPRAHVGAITHARLPLELLDLVSGRAGPQARADKKQTTDHAHSSDSVGEPAGPGAGGPAPCSDEHRRQRGHAHGHHHESSHGHAHRPHAPHPSPPAEATSGDAFMERRAHRSAHAFTVGWILHGDCILDADRLTAWVREASRSTSAIRLKAVVRSRTGWWGYNVVRGAEEIRPAAWRRSSRIELVCPPNSAADPDVLDATLRACIVQGPME